MNIGIVWGRVAKYYEQLSIYGRSSYSNYELRFAFRKSLKIVSIKKIRTIKI